MDTKKLRQKILDLAIHGKLVPQDPNDEPASVLLERIKAEKEQLIKEGKIKRQKKSTSSDMSHYGNDVPFEVPKGWVWCRLGDVFSHNTGKALNSSNKEGENLTYITTSNVYWDRFELNDLKKMPFTNSELEKCTVSKGDLLVCEGGDIGRSAIWNFDYDIRIQNHIHRLRPISEANVHFYYYVLMYNKQAGLIGGKGIGLMGLSSGELDKMIVPLPPIKEQCRITKEIEKLFAIVSLIEEDESALKNAIQKAKSTILDLALSGRLTSHTSHYGKWPYLPLSDIFNITMGQSPDGYYINQNNDGIEFHQGKLHFGQRHLLNSGVFTSNVTKVADAYSLLMCVRAPVGVLNITDRKVCIGRGLCALKPKDSNMPIEYWYYALSSLSNYFEENSTGTTFKAITMDVIKTTYVHVPPINEQRLIARQLEHIYQIIDSILKM